MFCFFFVFPNARLSQRMLINTKKCNLQRCGVRLKEKGKKNLFQLRLHRHRNGDFIQREEKGPERRDGIKMYKKRKETGCCRCQDPICMNGKGLNCRGWGSHPPPPFSTPLSFFFFFGRGGTKRRL